MNPILLGGLAALACLASFVAGVVTHAYVISQAEKIKAHVTAAVDGAEARIRADVQKLRSDASSDLSKVAAKV